MPRRLSFVKHGTFDAVIFDIDNVLIDTRRSYQDAIRWTVEIYLTCGNVPLFLAPPRRSEPTLLSPQDVNEFKLLGGFNDDWDCCYAFLVYLLALPVKKRTLGGLKQQMKLKDFTKKVKKRPLRVNGIVQMLGRPPAVTIERIARIFQEVYLGKELFRLSEHKDPYYWNKRGLIHKEKLIFRPSTLEKLKSMGIKMGIATGRPRFEALHALKHFGILDYFEAITTIDEIRKAEQEMKQSLRKPHPFSVLETAKKLGHGLRFLYVGDLPDDVLSANQAKDTIDIYSVAFPWFSGNVRSALSEIEKIGADFLLEKPAGLAGLVKRKRIALKSQVNV